MPSPGRQRGGGSKRGSAGGKRDGRRNPGKALRSKGVGWLRHSGTEEDLGKTNKELRAERKTYTDKSGPVRKATKREKAKMQRKLDNASKTAGETKPKRTGSDARTKVGGGAPGSAISRALAGGRYSR